MAPSSKSEMNLGKTFVVYLGSAWVVIEAFSFLIAKYEWPESYIDFIILVLAFGLPSTLIYTWFNKLFTMSAILLQVANISIAIGTISYTIDIQDLSTVRARSSISSDSGLNSLAVLPIDNITGDVDQAYFALGMQDALINELGQISSLRVISRRSTMAYQAVKKKIPEIANELGVGAIIEASLLSSNDSVMIQIRLIQAFPEERSLWTHTYTRKMDDIFSLYQDVAKAITNEIDITLTVSESQRLSDAKQVDPEVYKNYLKGQFHWEKLTKKELEIAMKYFEMAIKKDPKSALGYVGVSLVWGGYMQMGYSPINEVSPMMEKAYLQALERDESMFEVRYMMALNGFWNWEWKETVKQFEIVIDLNPNFAIARAYYSHILFILNRNEEAMEQMKLALELDPLNPLFKALYAMDLNMNRQCDESIKVLTQLIKDSPNFSMAYSTLRTAYHCEEMYQQAYEIWKRSFSKDSIALKALIKGFDEGGYSLSLQRVAEVKIKNLDVKHSPSWQIATLYARAGKSQEALEWLQKAYEDHDPNMPYMNIDPIFDYLRNETEFKDLLLKMNLPDKN